MIFDIGNKTLFKDFLTYYKRNSDDDLYFVSPNNPELVKHLEEFFERRMN